MLPFQAPDPAPLPYISGSETLVLMPDTQNYQGDFYRHFQTQTQWIVDHREDRRIGAVLHLGDVTNNNEPGQWEKAKACMDLFRGNVPFAMALGNHDYGPGGNATTRETHAMDHFPLEAYRKDMHVVGVFEPGRIDNLAHTFRFAGSDWLVLNLEFGPRDRVVRWANDVVRRYPRHRAILITHAYLFADDTRYDIRTRPEKPWNPHQYGIEKLSEKPNDGEELWDKLVRKYRNFEFVFNGHVLEDGQGRLTSRGDKGNLVHQHLANFQMLAEGGQGYLRLMEFLPDGRTVRCKTYSPSLDRYKTDPAHQFTIDLKAGTVQAGVGGS